MSNAPPLTQMQAQFNSLLDSGWGKPTLITRFSGTKDAAGHVSGSYSTLAASEQVWIQTLAGRSSIDTKNLDAETTHIAFQKLTGIFLRPKDRLLPSGATYYYDVINTEEFETHRMSQLKQDLRG
jgi:hypothetical protein